MSSITPEQHSTMMNQPSPFHGLTTPAPFVFDDQSKVLYVRLQYGSLLPYEIQEQDIPFIPIDLSRIVYRPDEGTGSDNGEMAFRDNWLLGHLLPRVLLGMDSFFESHGLDWSPSDEIQEGLPSEDRTCSERATLELLSFSFPHDPMVQFNVSRPPLPISFMIAAARRISMSLFTSMGNSPASFVTLSGMSCCLQTTAVSTTCMLDETWSRPSRK
jgi:hypothetical protein